MPARAGNLRWAPLRREAGIVERRRSSPGHSRRIPVIAASRVASGLGWKPSASSGRSPAPIPSISLPPEISSTVAAAAAVIAG